MRKLNYGSLTRLVDPEKALRTQIARFVSDGDFGLASGVQGDGGYSRVWYKEDISQEEIMFEPGAFF